MTIALRSNVNECALLPSIRAAVSDIDKSVPVYGVQTMDAMVSDAGSLRRFDLSLLAMFSGLALASAAIGVYAVMAYFVSQRTQEIGIRIALGARSSDVLSLILNQGARLAFTGVAAGVIAALLLRRVMGESSLRIERRQSADLLHRPLVDRVGDPAGLLPAGISSDQSRSHGRFAHRAKENPERHYLLQLSDRFLL